MSRCTITLRKADQGDGAKRARHHSSLSDNNVTELKDIIYEAPAERE